MTLLLNGINYSYMCTSETVLLLAAAMVALIAPWATSSSIPLLADDHTADHEPCVAFDQ